MAWQVPGLIGLAPWLGAAVCGAAGLVLGWSLRGRRGQPGAHWDIESKRIQTTLSQIKALATGLAHEVDEHSAKVQEMAIGIGGLKGRPRTGSRVAHTLAEILAASQHLQLQFQAAQQKLERQAEEIQIHAAHARTDRVTGVGNRRAFDDELQRCFAEWKRLQSPYSLFLLDIDHFKELNDRYGHQAGDEVLRHVAGVLRDVMREMDHVCRYGGDEFAVIMPASEGAVAKRGAERARAAIHASRFQHKGAEITVTASLGLAEILPGEDNATLLRRADEALYSSKRAGRNKTHFHDGQQPRSVRALARQNAAAQAPQDEQQQVVARMPGTSEFLGTLRRRAAETHRTGVPMSIMQVDVVDYEEVIRQDGTPAGDLLLDAVAQYLDLLVRDMDLVAHLEGGRFGVLLPGSSLANAATMLGRVHRTMAGAVLAFDGLNLQPRVRLGFAELMPGENAAVLLRRAGAAVDAADDEQPSYVHDGSHCRPLAQVEPAAI